MLETLFEIILTSLALCADTLAVSLALGLGYPCQCRRAGMRIALVFGVVQGAMPLARLSGTEVWLGEKSARVSRGELLSRNWGCVSCHERRPPGVPHPAGKGGFIPAWTPEAPRIFTRTETEINDPAVSLNRRQRMLTILFVPETSLDEWR